MSKALALLACAIGMAQLACGGGGGGGGAGGSGGGGAGGGGGEGGYEHDHCHDIPLCGEAPACIPSCASGQLCFNATCYNQYTLRFVDCPAVWGPKLHIVLEVRPYPGQPPLTASEVVATYGYKGQPVQPVTVTADPNQDNVFDLDLDFTQDLTLPSDNVPLGLTVYPAAGPGTFVTCDVSVDNLPPRVTPRLPTFSRRNEPITVRADVDDADMQGGRVMARLGLPDHPAPLPPDVSPAGWVDGSVVAGQNGTWTFTLDQSGFSLPGLTGDLDVYFWAADQFGNSHVTRGGSVPISRNAWTRPGNGTGTVLSGVGASGSGITNAPAVDQQGRVALLASGSGDNLALFDPVTGDVSRYAIGLSGAAALAPVFDSGGRLYAVSYDSLGLYELPGTDLNPVKSCATPNHARISSPPVLVSPTGQEWATYTRSDGSLAEVGVDSASTPPVCTAEQATPAALNAADTSPAATVDSEGRTLEVIGGQRPSTLSTYLVGDGSFTLLNAYAPDGVDVLRNVPLAIDQDTVYAAPPQRRQASSFQYSHGFDQAPTQRTFVFENAVFDTVGPPIVSQHAVIFPTSTGLRALPRFGPWAQDAVVASAETFKAPAVAGQGDVLYAVNYAGKLYVLQYSESPAPTLDTLWSAQIGDPGETFSVSPALTCRGLLILASERGSIHAVSVDSKGLDPMAPWPKVLHDGRNTGNSVTSVDCFLK